MRQALSSFRCLCLLCWSSWHRVSEAALEPKPSGDATGHGGGDRACMHHGGCETMDTSQEPKSQRDIWKHTCAQQQTTDNTNNVDTHSMVQASFCNAHDHVQTPEGGTTTSEPAPYRLPPCTGWATPAPLHTLRLLHPPPPAHNQRDTPSFHQLLRNAPTNTPPTHTTTHASAAAAMPGLQHTAPAENSHVPGCTSTQQPPCPRRTIPPPTPDPPAERPT